MKWKNLIPWKQEEGEERADAQRGSTALAERETADPFSAFQSEMNRMMDRFFDGFGAMSDPWGGRWYPETDVSETDKEVVISAELPGLNQEDLDIRVSGNALTIRGEKRSEHRDEEGERVMVERSYGSFERRIPLPTAVRDDQAEASYKDGVLTIRLPKREEAVNGRRRIPVSG